MLGVIVPASAKALADKSSLRSGGSLNAFLFKATSFLTLRKRRKSREAFWEAVDAAKQEDGRLLCDEGRLRAHEEWRH